MCGRCPVSHKQDKSHEGPRSTWSLSRQHQSLSLRGKQAQQLEQWLTMEAMAATEWAPRLPPLSPPPPEKWRGDRTFGVESESLEETQSVVYCCASARCVCVCLLAFFRSPVLEKSHAKRSARGLEDKSFELFDEQKVARIYRT